MSKWFEKVPSFVWILVIIAAIALFIGGMIGGFYVITHIEWVGSIFLLVCAWGCLRFGANSPEIKSDGALGKVGLAILITFFAMMGVGLDQPGNLIYNKPMEWIFCPADSELRRDVTRRAARGGGVSVEQNFTCTQTGGEQISRKIGMWEMIFFRFFEYVLLGYVLLGLSRLYSRIRGLPKKKGKPVKGKKSLTAT
jgi:hypothetical protein